MVSCVPLLLHGYPKGHDWLFELVRISEYRSALTSGQLPPAWAENLYGGHGSPIFLFYAPIFCFLGAVISFVCRSIDAAAVVALVAFSGVGALTMWRLIRSALDPSSPNARRNAVHG